MNPSYDVIVVGAGAAGCSLALLLARRGYGIILLESLPYAPVQCHSPRGSDAVVDGLAHDVVGKRPAARLHQRGRTVRASSC